MRPWPSLASALQQPSYTPCAFCSRPLPWNMSAFHSPSYDVPYGDVHLPAPSMRSMFHSPSYSSPLDQRMVPWPVRCPATNAPLYSPTPLVMVPCPSARSFLKDPSYTSPLRYVILPCPSNLPLDTSPTYFAPLGNSNVPVPHGLAVSHCPSYTTPVSNWKRKRRTSLASLMFLERTHASIARCVVVSSLTFSSLVMMMLTMSEGDSRLRCSASMSTTHRCSLFTTCSTRALAFLLGAVASTTTSLNTRIQLYSLNPVWILHSFSYSSWRCGAISTWKPSYFLVSFTICPNLRVSSVSRTLSLTVDVKSLILSYDSWMPA
mmetsp:Transcript_43045/g.108725  ORF Transcript_43045/g.108725 Transcript_43045/m.108725 type:complete len:320 (-) Transcript_43045:1234-2193(-)